MTINGVTTKSLPIHRDERGMVMEILRRDDAQFTQFGQVYLTTALPGVVKAWHCHRRQQDTLTCVSGIIRVGLYDGRTGSPTEGAVAEYIISRETPLLVQIPPEVHHGFECLSETEALVINVVSELYDAAAPDELRLDPFTPEIPFQWHGRRGR